MGEIYRRIGIQQLNSSLRSEPKPGIADRESWPSQGGGVRVGPGQHGKFKTVLQIGFMTKIRLEIGSWKG
jgi:hypothetical protein